MEHLPLSLFRYYYSPNCRLPFPHNSNSSPSSSSSSSSALSSSSLTSFFRSSRGFNCNFSKISGMKNIWKAQGVIAQAMSMTQEITSPNSFSGVTDEPDHLLVLVHGINSDPGDWRGVEPELKQRLGRNFLIYASSCNTYRKSFAGIDIAGKRLADEVLQIVKMTGSLRKISFLAHSLGGLLARYAIAVLYTPNASSGYYSDNLADPENENSNKECSLRKSLIAGLEPINFITLATPHLGVRGKKQLPFLLGVTILEKIAPPIAPLFVGQTGSQLFLADGKPDKPPLLLRMASDCEDGKFISSLSAFRCRVAYANVSFDHMVGWRTSSIRREAELIKCPLQSLDGYPEVVSVEYCPPVSSSGPNFDPKAAKSKEAAQTKPNSKNTTVYHEIVEEEIICGLQQLGWRKVDVNFQSVFRPFYAHNNMHAGVVAHVADSLKQQESSSLAAAAT